MNAQTAFSIISLVFLLGATHYALAASPRAGDYLEDDFIEALTATRSPVLALQDAGHGPHSITVLDQTGNHFDYVYFGNDPARPNSFAFTQTGDTLRLYPLIKPTERDDPSIGAPDKTHPAYILTRRDAHSPAKAKD